MKVPFQIKSIILNCGYNLKVVNRDRLIAIYHKIKDRDKNRSHNFKPKIKYIKI